MDPKVGIRVEIVISRCHLLGVQQLGHLAPSWAAGLCGHMMDTLHRLGWNDRLRGLSGGTAHLKGEKVPKLVLLPRVPFFSSPSSTSPALIGNDFSTA